MNRNNNSDYLDKTNPLISVVLSFRNEEDVIPELIKRLRNILRKDYEYCYELIFVNDNSIDRSRELLMKQAKGYNDIRIINMSRTFAFNTKSIQEQCTL